MYYANDAARIIQGGPNKSADISSIIIKSYVQPSYGLHFFHDYRV